MRLTRRTFLCGAAVSAAPGRKLKVVVAGGHPGDPEYGCGGTIARYTDIGHDVALLYLNRGEGGIRGKSEREAGEIRTAEAIKACEILKARPVFAGQIDGKAVIDDARYADFRKILDAERPDVVFTQWPVDNHRDHRAIATLVYDAWRQMRRNFALYFYEVSNGEDTVMFAPSAYVDVTGFEARKRAACYAHASQAPERFYPLQDEVARFRGIESGHVRAEAFLRHVQGPAGFLPG